MKLVVIIPAFNEEKTIKGVIEKIPRNIEGISNVEIVVIDDGSQDETAKHAAEAGAYVFSNGTNQGVGFSFSRGLREALQREADIIVNIDADGQFNPFDIPILIRPILENKADFVTASRFKDKSLIPEMPAVKIWGNKMFAKMINFITGGNFTDVSCGFRAFSLEAALRLNLFGKFTYTQETFINLYNKDMRICEVPLKIRGEREFGKSKVAKNLWVYGYKSFIIIMRAFRDYQPMKFFGGFGTLFGFIGFVSGIFIFIHWFITGTTFPYRSLVVLSFSFLILGLLFIATGLLADMLSRNRKVQEEILYFEKKRAYRKK